VRLAYCPCAPVEGLEHRRGEASFHALMVCKWPVGARLLLRSSRQALGDGRSMKRLIRGKAGRLVLLLRLRDAGVLEGQTLQAIGTALGVDRSTILRDLRVLDQVEEEYHRLTLAHTTHAGAVGWALAATAMIPAAGYTCYRLGQTESRGVKDGLAAGIGAVMKAANETASLKVNVTHAMRQPPMSQPQVIELPPLPPVQHVTTWGSGDVIDV